MGDLALKDIRVVDFTWVISGPYTTKMLADQGAEVIKLETESTVRAFRYDPTTKFQVPLNQIDRGPAFDLHNRNKLAITLNLKSAEGLEIAKRLIKISDVVVENFSAKAMKNLGLDYPVLREINPGIIMISMAGFGHSGPYKDYISHGPTLHALYGVDELTGYPDGLPVGPGFTYSDYASGVHGAFAILAAIRHRSKTGEGQYIDMSQLDTGTSLMSLYLLEAAANGTNPTRVGNRSLKYAPHGCYRCQGEERWCTIVVANDQEWQTFCRVIGDPEWTKDAKFGTHLNRVKNAEELDRLIETWTVNHSPEEITVMMQSAGVEAGIVQTTKDILTSDRHVEYRKFYEEVTHPIRDLELLEGMPYKMSRTQGSVRTTGPFGGEHNDYVFREVMGMTPEEIDRYVEAGVIA